MTVGQLIASIGSGEGAPAAAPEAKPQEQELPFLSSMADPKSMAAPSRAAPPPPPVPHLRTAPPPPYHAAPAAGAAAAAAAGKRKPLIRFPPRRTEGGDRISEMPAAQAQAYLEGGCAGSVGRAAGSGRRCLGRLFGQAAWAGCICWVGWAGAALSLEVGQAPRVGSCLRVGCVVQGLDCATRPGGLLQSGAARWQRPFFPAPPFLPGAGCARARQNPCLTAALQTPALPCCSRGQGGRGGSQAAAHHCAALHQVGAAAAAAAAPAGACGRWRRGEGGRVVAAALPCAALGPAPWVAQALAS